MVIMMIHFLLIILLSNTPIVLPADNDTYSHSTYVIDVTHRHSSNHSTDQDAEHISNTISYVLGSNSQYVHAIISEMMRKKMRDSQELRENVRSLTIPPSDHTLATANDNDEVQRYADIKKLVGQCVEEALKSNNEDLMDYKLQMDMKDKDILLAKKKLYAALATSGFSLAGILVTFFTTYFTK